VTARTRGKRKRQGAGHAEERALIELLSHGLWEEEIQRVLACALLALDERGAIAFSPGSVRSIVSSYHRP
jgi:hypothetical protein